MNTPKTTPIIPTIEPPFERWWRPTAAFGFDVFDAVEEPAVLLPELPEVLVVAALATC